MRTHRSLALIALLAALAPADARAETPAQDPCQARVALLEKRLGALQQRLRVLEHELASRPSGGAASDAWQDRQAWQQLRPGMTQAEVLRILGTPGRVTSYYGFQRWEYPDALGARVNFDESGRLLVWGGLAR